MSRELEVSDRIDLGARLGPVMTACIGVATRGVQVPHGMHIECQAGRRRRARTFERCDTYDRTVFAGSSHHGTRTPNRLTSFTSGALTTSGSDRVAAAIF